tara:strand:- start:21 stop:791 length:771 start_codon:yes stop_codon:yes gene_type:complete
MNDLDKFQKLINIIKKLRAPGGCDWDRKQTSTSLIPYLTEEAYEVIDAIEQSDTSALREELGDLLLHILFQAEIRSEKNDFDIFDSIDSVCNKLIKRHPEVFNDSDKDNVVEKGSWEKRKKIEKNRKSILEGVPNSLPGLLRARRIQEKASSVGFDWKNHRPVIEKIQEELDEVNDAIKNHGKEEVIMEIGDLLFAVVNLSRFFEIDPERALKKSTNKFIKRFNSIEERIKLDGGEIKEYSLDFMESLWNEIKKDE